MQTRGDGGARLLSAKNMQLAARVIKAQAPFLMNFASKLESSRMGSSRFGNSPHCAIPSR